MFDDATKDYDQTIRIADSQGRNDENAHFNKGNVLVLCGRFSEALRCYHRSSQAPDSGAANNKANVARVLERIGDARFTCHVSESSPLSKSLAHVSVEVAANATGSERLVLPVSRQCGEHRKFRREWHPWREWISPEGWVLLSKSRKRRMIPPSKRRWRRLKTSSDAIATRCKFWPSDATCLGRSVRRAETA